MDIRLIIAICGLIIAVGPLVVVTINTFTGFFSEWSIEKKLKWGTTGFVLEAGVAIVFGMLFLKYLCNTC